MNTRGHVKLHRKFLLSKVRWQKESVVRLFLDLLLLVDYQTGTLETSYRKLSQISVVRGMGAIQEALKALKGLEVIDFTAKPTLKITFRNWERYQARKAPKKAKEVFLVEKRSVSSSETGVFLVEKRSVSSSETPPIHKVPVPSFNLKNKEFFISKKSNLDFQNPKTDLEKLALYYLQGTNHPALKKTDNNEILNAAVHMDIPHFETILANCRDLEQAKACVARYVRRAKGLYSLYYLACQINSIRQEIESEEMKNGKFLRPGQRHAEQL